MANHTLDLTTLLQRFQAIGEETRLRILHLLSEGERCVCDLQADLGAAQSRLSFHLKKLRGAGVVADRREGRWVYYSLRPEALQEMRDFLGEVASGEGSRWSGGGAWTLPCCTPEGGGDEGSPRGRPRKVVRAMRESPRVAGRDRHSTKGADDG